MAIKDKRTSVVENFKEEFSVKGAMELLEGLGYKVMKELPIEEAKAVLKENGYIVTTPEKMELAENLLVKKVKESQEDTDVVMLWVANDETLYNIALKAKNAKDLKNQICKNADLIGDDFDCDGVNWDDVLVYIKEDCKKVKAAKKVTESKIEEAFREIKENGGVIILPEHYERVVETFENVIVDAVVESLFEEFIILESEDEIVESLKEDGYLVLDKETADKVDEELKRLVKEEAQKLLESKNEDENEDEPEEDGDIIDDVIDDEDTEEANESKKETKKVTLAEKLLGETPRKNEEAVADVAKNVDNGETDLTGEDDAVAHVADNIDNGETDRTGMEDDVAHVADKVEDKKESKTEKGSKRILAESLIG